MVYLYLPTITQDMVTVLANHLSKDATLPSMPSSQQLIRKTGNFCSKIVVWGRSLGTGPSCYLAEKKFGGLILETPFITALSYGYRNPVLPWDRFRNINRAPHTK